LVDNLRAYSRSVDASYETLAYNLHSGVSRRPDDIHALVPILSQIRDQVDGAARVTIEFLARRLIRNTYYGEITYVAGTPLFVSLPDVYDPNF